MTKHSQYPKAFLERLKAVKSKRPKTVISHLLKHGFITTEELEQKYGYKHAPRAARDVRGQGIPLETFRVKDKTGRSIAAYRFADPFKVYEVAGDVNEAERNLADYMLLCGSCNRAKSWSCEHCANWLEIKKPEACRTCYWANLESYKHIALRDMHRLEIIWMEKEVEQYESLKQRVEILNEPMPDYVKAVLKRHLDEVS